MCVHEIACCALMLSSTGFRMKLITSVTSLLILLGCDNGVFQFCLPASANAFVGICDDATLKSIDTSTSAISTLLGAPQPRAFKVGLYRKRGSTLTRNVLRRLPIQLSMSAPIRPLGEALLDLGCLLTGLSQADACASAIFVDEYDAGFLKSFPYLVARFAASTELTFVRF